MTDTTIPVSSDVRDSIADRKRDGETYNQVLKRLLGEQDGQLWTKEEIKAICERVIDRQTRR